LPSQKNSVKNLEINEIKNMFKEEINENKEKSEMIKDNEKYKKYFKMKSMKIPIMAIKNKMILNNLDTSIINYDGNTLTKKCINKR
jgi:Predicted coiled-coil domain-containing protein (DUF2360).